MFAACTNEDVLENFDANQAAKSEGITFAITEGVQSRGDFKMDEATKKFIANWNAEVDKISIAYKGVEVGIPTGSIPSGYDWDASNVATYKATKTAAKGEFTSLNETNLLSFTKTTATNGSVIGAAASFRAFRNEGSEVINYTSGTSAAMTISAEVGAVQTQASATKAPFDNFVMVSDPIDNVYKADYAVGESLPLSFERAFAGLVINTTGYDKNIYGNLLSVQVKTTESVIAGQVTLDILKKNAAGKWGYTGTPNGKSVTLNMGSATGLEWNDEYYAFMQILPVDRSDLRVSEEYTVTLTFANGVIVVEKTSSKNWEANNFYTINVDLDAAGDYLYNNGTLSVIKALPTLNASNQFGTVAATDVTTLISGKALTAAELAVLKNKFTALTTVTLANEGADLGTNLGNLPAGITTLTLSAAKTAPVINSHASLTTLSCPAVTTIPDAAFKGNTVITKYNFPKVETIGKEAFSGATQITTIGCVDATNSLIIGTTNTSGVATSALTTVGEKAFAGMSLTSVHAPAVTTMGNYAFGTNTSGCAITNLKLSAYDWAASTDLMTSLYLLSNNESLEVVDFSGTTTIEGTTIPKIGNRLTTVTLAPNTNLGANAFASQTALTTVNNLNKVASVGDNAFKGATSLAGDIKFVNTVAAIGAGAFANTAIVSFDFTGVTTIGEGAFENTALTMLNVPSVEVLEADVFNGCSLVGAAQFDAATSIKNGALVGLQSGANIVFKKAITTFEAQPFTEATFTLTDANKSKDTPVQLTANYNLYVNADQEGVSGNKLTYKVGDYYYQVTFTKIVK